MRLSALEWIGLLASIFTIISVTLNIYQWRRQRDMRSLYYTSLFIIYNHMYRIAELADCCRREYDKEGSPSVHFTNTIRYIEQITGITDSSRQEALAFSEKLLGKAVWRQYPICPSESLLRKENLQNREMPCRSI